jgi:hypothetical protein
VEDREFSEAQRAEILGLGGVIFESAQEFHDWFNNV